MALKAAQCPNCGGELQLPEDKNIVTCIYCDTSIVVKEAIEKKAKAAGGDVESWMHLAETSREADNDEEAIQYYNKILEVESDNAQAWFGKAECILKTSKIGELKVKEGITFFKNAVKFSSDSEEMKVMVSKSLKETIKLFFVSAISHYDEFSGTGNASDEVYYKVNQLFDALDYILEIKPNDKEYIQLGIDLCINSGRQLIGPNINFRGFTAKDSEFAPRYIHYTDMMRKLNPEYKEPKYDSMMPGPIAWDWTDKDDLKGKGGFCFIATATMGDYDHPVVMDLRIFRDKWMLEKSWGRRFVELYYKYGPYLARTIEGNRILKKMSYWFIVKPLHYMTKLFK